MLETDLYMPIHDYFEKLGYDVHGEVKDCDITASKGDELIIIELKCNLSLQLLIQAAKGQRITENVYVAIPKPNYSLFTKKWKDLCFIVRRLELGLITVSFKNEVEKIDVVFHPSPFDRRKSMQMTKKKRKDVTSEIDGRHGNYNLGGSTGTKLNPGGGKSSSAGGFLMFVMPQITHYALIAHRNLAERARLLALHSSADGRTGSRAISE